MFQWPFLMAKLKKGWPISYYNKRYVFMSVLCFTVGELEKKV